MALNTLPYMKKGMESNYRTELECLLTQYTMRLFEQVCDDEGLYRSRSRFETNLILRYHCQAVMGLLRTWTDADTKELDRVVHVVYRLMNEGIPPLE